jgi:ribosomal protein S18 acetylase RimI-like enzyme
VQVQLASKENASHRGEVQKLLVHRRFRRKGIARELMGAVETVALECGRTLLVLDTELGSAAQRLYEDLGYIRVGIILRYARRGNGALHDTVMFYRLLRENDVV